MIYVYLLFSCVAFIELFIFLDVKKEATSLINKSRHALSVVTSRDLSDHEKERIVRSSAIEIFKATFVFFGKFSLIVAIMFGTYWLTISALPNLIDPIIASFVSPTQMLGLLVFATVYLWIRGVIVS